MSSDSALLPPTIHLGYLPDERIIAHLACARESIRFVGPGLSVGAARVLAERWQDLGPFANPHVRREGGRRIGRSGVPTFQNLVVLA